MARVFSAVDIEDFDVLKEIENVRDSFDLGFKPVDKEKMHMTLQFFGELENGQIQEIKDAMNRTSLDGFNAEVNGVGSFPSRDYIRVLWAGLESPELFQLYNQVSDHSVPEENDHEFRPHITFLRIGDVSGQKKRKLKRMLREYEDHLFGEINVERVKLYESRLKPSGPEYRQLHVKQL